MKILILSKKFLLSIILFSLFFSFLISSFFKPFSFAFELTVNSVVEESVKEKIATLTKAEEKIAYLTFDDGPTLKATGKILDILKEENVKATFFVVGKHVKEHPELVKRAYDEGHYLANHGYHHDNKMLYQSDDSFFNEIKNTDIEIGKAIGVQDYCSHVFRFPNGYMSSHYKAKKKEATKILDDMNYTYIDWNCLNHDSVKKYSKDQLLKNLKKSSKNKGTLVILMHDTSDVNDTPSILKDSIHYLKDQGYEFRNFYDFRDNVKET